VRWNDLEQQTLTRVYAISDPTSVTDPDYLRGLRAAVSAALEYGLSALSTPGNKAEPVPVLLLAQARTAARSNVSLDTVLRRYLAGYSLLADFLVSESVDREIKGDDLRNILAALAAACDRLVTAISEEFGREAGTRSYSSDRRRAEQIEGLLNGELVDHSSLTADLAYDFDANHIAVISVGPSGPDTIRKLAAAANSRPLVLKRPEQTTWAWLGAQRVLDPAELQSLASAARSPGLALAIGESERGLAGWRLSHRQATAALAIALRSPARIARYSEVALIASVCNDELLAVSLRQQFLEPLDDGRDGGAAARETLRAYLAAGCNTSSAAAMLGINRHTAASRIHAIERRLKRPIGASIAEIETALKLEEFLELSPSRR
jgi:hypothetical protein